MRIDDRPGGLLHLFESLEALSLGIEGKLVLWWTLKAVADLSADLARSDYERLIKRNNGAVLKLSGCNPQ